jgi:hypothetical protein
MSKPKGYTILNDGFSFDITVFSDFQRVKTKLSLPTAVIGIKEAITGSIPYWSDGVGFFKEKNQLFVDFIKLFDFKEDNSLNKSIACFIGKLFNQSSILWISQSYFQIIDCSKYLSNNFIPYNSLVSISKTKLKDNQHPTFKQLVNTVI